MSNSQLICTQCPKTFEEYKTKKGILSKVCPKCREIQIKSEIKRKDRVRNYQAEAKRNLENNWITFQKKSVEKRNKDLGLTKEQYFEFIQAPCTYCNYYNEDEINGIDRIDNEKGYILNNCVSCCKNCNRMKHIFHPVFFIEKAKLITKFQQNKLEDSERNEFYKFWKIYVHKIPTGYIYIKRTTEERRKIEYSLTKDQYDELIYKPCHLCGFKNQVGNGLDRQDNSIGYTYENVLPCCSTCNMMKAFYTTDKFIQQIQKITEFKKEYPKEWDIIPCKGFQMGSAKTDEVKKDCIKQWRAVSIYKAVKSGSIEDFKNITMESTKWNEAIFEEKTRILFEKVVGLQFEEVETELKKLVETIRYERLKY